MNRSSGISLKAILLLLISSFLASPKTHSQCTQFVDFTTPTCTVAYTDGCATFKNSCNSTSGWTPTNGTPELIGTTIYESPPDQGKTYTIYTPYMAATTDSGEGMFKPYPFIKGQTYSITITYSISQNIIGSTGLLNLVAANGLTQNIVSCLSPIPNIPANERQTIYQLSSGTSATFTFTPNQNYQDLWLYATSNPGQEITAIVSNLEICTCSTPFVSNVEGSNVSWYPVNGANSYNINFVTGANNSPFTFTPTTITAPFTENFTPIPSGTYTVSVQANCGTSGLSNWGTYNEAIPIYSYTCVTPTISYVQGVSGGVDVSWGSTTGANSYNINITNASGNITSFPYTPTIINPTYTKLCTPLPSGIYQVSVQASCSAGPSNWSTYGTTVTVE